VGDKTIDTRGKQMRRERPARMVWGRMQEASSSSGLLERGMTLLKSNQPDPGGRKGFVREK